MSISEEAELVLGNGVNFGPHAYSMCLCMCRGRIRSELSFCEARARVPLIPNAALIARLHLCLPNEILRLKISGYLVSPALVFNTKACLFALLILKKTMTLRVKISSWPDSFIWFLLELRFDCVRLRVKQDKPGKLKKYKVNLSAKTRKNLASIFSSRIFSGWLVI